jgi:hypothetical protein
MFESSAPLALTGEEFEDLLEEEPDHPEDGFDFNEHGDFRVRSLEK